MHHLFKPSRILWDGRETCLSERMVEPWFSSKTVSEVKNTNLAANPQLANMSTNQIVSKVCTMSQVVF